MHLRQYSQDLFFSSEPLEKSMSEEEMVGQEDGHPVSCELTIENKTTLQNLF